MEIEVFDCEATEKRRLQERIAVLEAWITWALEVGVPDNVYTTLIYALKQDAAAPHTLRSKLDETR